MSSGVWLPLENGAGFNLVSARFMPSEFPRMEFGGNSPHCIKTEADKGHDHYDCSPLPPTDRVLPSQP